MTNHEMCLFVADGYDVDGRRLLKTQVRYRNLDNSMSLSPAHDIHLPDNLLPSDFIEFVKNQVSFILDITKKECEARVQE
jgi:hypothetical protein